VWRHPNPARRSARRSVDAPTLRPIRSTCRDEEGHRARPPGKVFTDRGQDGARGLPTAYLDVSVAAGPRPDGQIVYLLFEARDITELKAPRSSFARARRWRRWASSPAASRTTSTIS
jgi:hypothetical protein